ncbi:hypothetical protein K435DRAFT_860450 [Dendrothele bispora CBS 962.96]|uniref:Uncharacterized protein n=1 Tax=Dendrothele bispora (strain CBS 962.96) TaxID=1314807 RepID=A0A4S8LXS1_DENBC|nr:hypothetical protein K435DRAFT_860450 [Dendrothele bispora CBS 962.96]
MFELDIRIKYSGWMKRLWTLQEASLAIDTPKTSGKLYFQMSDGLILWNKLSRVLEYSQARHRPPRKSKGVLVENITDIKRTLTFTFDIEVIMADRLLSVHDLRYGMDTPIQQLSRALRNHMTSKTEHEPICLMSLLGLDVEKLLNVKESIHMAAERMSMLYLLMQELPIGHHLC